MKTPNSLTELAASSKLIKLMANVCFLRTRSTLYQMNGPDLGSGMSEDVNREVGGGQSRLIRTHRNHSSCQGRGLSGGVLFFAKDTAWPWRETAEEANVPRLVVYVGDELD